MLKSPEYTLQEWKVSTWNSKLFHNANHLSCRILLLQWLSLPKPIKLFEFEKVLMKYDQLDALSKYVERF